MYSAAQPGSTAEDIKSQASSLYDQISKDLGIGKYSNLKAKIGYSAMNGKTKPNNSSAIASADWNSTPKRIQLWNPFFFNRDDVDQAQTIIGEAIHIETRMYDSDLSKIIGGWTTPTGVTQKKIEDSASQYFHSKVSDVCKK
jgi:hypothetical protein